MSWKEYTYDFQGLNSYLERIHYKKASLDVMRPLPVAAIRRILENLCLEWTYNSNGIEGNTMTLQETKLIIEDGLTVGGKTLREHFEVLNHQKAIQLILDLTSRPYILNNKDILEVHRIILHNIEQEMAGQYRNHGVRISGANFVPPNALKVYDLMEELVDWFNTTHALDTIIKVSIFHHRFVWIHPFIDGNGRTVRLMFNAQLMKEGFPPAIILKQDRKKYYDALNKANQGDYGKIVLLTLQALERSLDIYLTNLTNTYEDYMPISQIVEDPKMPYGQEYISLLARRGYIDAFKEGKSWLTSKKAIQSYISGRQRTRKL